MPAIHASAALSRLRIVDLSRVRAGPTCVRQFADFGADVIKIESPPGVDPNENMGGPRDGPDMQNLHRNKRAMTLPSKRFEISPVVLHKCPTGAAHCHGLFVPHSHKLKTIGRPAAFNALLIVVYASFEFIPSVLHQSNFR